MSHHVGFLYLADAYGNPREVINEARTLLALSNAGCAYFSNVYAGERIEGLGFHPCSMDGDGAVTEWVALDPDSPPWDDGSLAAADAYGFVIDEWSGLDGSVHRRPTRPRGPLRSGAGFGSQYSAERVMSINLVLVGGSEEGLNLLFRWLESTLLATCSPCETNTMWLREFHPGDDLEAGLVSLKDVVLVEGPTWVAESSVREGAHIRFCNVTLAAGDPCFRRVPGETVTETGRPSPIPLAEIPLGDDSENIPDCADFEGAAGTATISLAAPSYGEAYPIVTILHHPNALDAEDGAAPLRIIGFVDDGSGVPAPCSQRRRGFIAVDAIAAGTEIVIDCANLTAMARNQYRGIGWYDGSHHLVPDVVPYGGVKREPITTANCSMLHVVIEPGRRGLAPVVFLNDAGSVSGEGWTVTMQAASRFGCV